ncbi:MAG: hypothetical protein ACLGH7_07360 [Actinomycetes bacterium]
MENPRQKQGTDDGGRGLGSRPERPVRRQVSGPRRSPAPEPRAGAGRAAAAGTVAAGGALRSQAIPAAVMHPVLAAVVTVVLLRLWPGQLQA